MSDVSGSPFSSLNWYAMVKRKMGGIPEAIWGSIIGVESAGSPIAKGDYENGTPTSFGLFQIHVTGGLGDKYANNPTALFNPELNAEIAAAAMKPAYDAGVKKGLSGYDLTKYVAANSGWPTQSGTLPSDYESKLFLSYQSYGGGGTVLPGVSAGVETGHAYTNIFSTLAAIENIDLSVTSPIQSTKKLAVMVMLVLLGLILVTVGLIAFIGTDSTAKVIASVAAPGSDKVLDAAKSAADAGGLSE